MAKFNIIYTVESTDLDSATHFAHEVLFLANADVESIQIRPQRTEPTDEQWEKYRTFDEPAVETNPSIYERVNSEWKKAHPWITRGED